MGESENKLRIYILRRVWAARAKEIGENMTKVAELHISLHANLQ